jgi:hypothetical protein
MTTAPAPDTPQQRVLDLIAMTERLNQLIGDQAKAFEARRPQDATPGLEETSRLANLYRQETQRVRADPSLIAGAAPEFRARLLRATEAFDVVMARQHRALTAAKTVTEGLVQAIAQEVAAQRSRGASYGPSGARPDTAAVTAVTLNRRA